MKVKKSMVFAAALACGLLLAVPLGAAAASGSRTAENKVSAREESGRLNRTFLCLNVEYNDRAPQEQLTLDAGDRVVSWRSADPSIAQVNGNGVVTACAEGITNIYADTERGATLSCAVTVVNNIGRVTLNESRLYLNNMGDKATLTASVAVENPAAVSITWRSSNSSVATVDANGVVTAVGEGEATITATSSEGRNATCKVYTGAVAAQKQQGGNALRNLFQ